MTFTLVFHYRCILSRDFRERVTFVNLRVRLPSIPLVTKLPGTSVLTKIGAVREPDWSVLETLVEENAIFKHKVVRFPPGSIVVDTNTEHVQR